MSTVDAGAPGSVPARSGAGRVPTAKRDRVRRHLLDVIDAAGPGTGLASERDLAARLDVSRPTVRAAVDELVLCGRLVRQPGRGTFTSPNKITQQLSSSTTNALGVPPAEGAWSSRVVEFRTVAAGTVRAARFGVAAADLILRITRVRIVEGEPIAIELLELPADLVPDLAPADLESGNFYQYLRHHYDITVTQAVQTIEPAVTNPEQADLLDVPVYFPVLRIERTTQDARGCTVEHVQSVYRGDRYRITSTLRFDQGSG